MLTLVKVTIMTGIFLASLVFQFLAFLGDFTHRSDKSLPFRSGALGGRGPNPVARGSEIIPTYRTNIIHIVSDILIVRRDVTRSEQVARIEAMYNLINLSNNYSSIF